MYFSKNCELILRKILTKCQSRWQEEMTKPGSWLGKVRGSANYISLFFCEPL